MAILSASAHAKLSVRWLPNKPADGKPVLVYVAGAPARADVDGELLDQELAFRWDRHAKAHVALAAVPLGTKPGKKKLVVRATWDHHAHDVTRRVTTTSGRYPRAEVHLRDKKKDDPKATPEHAKVPGERPVSGKRQVKAALARETGERFWGLPFHRPLATKVTEHFGVRRVYYKYKGKKVVRRWRGRHMGLDLDGDGGEPIGAVAGGVVVVAGYFFGMGKAVLVDHGQRFFTSYFHMSRIDVKVGQRVRRGQVLGQVGATGLATGPHLHLEARINGARVDSLALLALTAGDDTTTAASTAAPAGKPNASPAAAASP